MKQGQMKGKYDQVIWRLKTMLCSEKRIKEMAGCETCKQIKSAIKLLTEPQGSKDKEMERLNKERDNLKKDNDLLRSKWEINYFRERNLYLAKFCNSSESKLAERQAEINKLQAQLKSSEVEKELIRVCNELEQEIGHMGSVSNGTLNKFSAALESLRKKGE